MQKRTPKLTVEYAPHYQDHAHGHIFIDKPGACVISLAGSSAMSQDELNFWGQKIAKALSQVNPKEFKCFWQSKLVQQSS